MSLVPELSLSQTQCQLYKHINLLDITEDALALGFHGELSAVYQIEPQKDILLMNDSSQESFLKGVKLLLEALPPRSAITTVVDIEQPSKKELERLKTLVQGLPGDLAEIIEAKVSLLENTPRKSRRTHLILGYYPRDFLKLPLFPKIMLVPG
ncbi:MAG: hypothetical protein AAB037_01325 [Chloroflexota bacterium]